MLQLWMIAMVAVVMSGDAVASVFTHTPSAPSQAGSSFVLWKMLACVGMPLAIAMVTHLVCSVCSRQVDRTGDWRAVDAADRMILWSRPLTVVALVGAVFSLGWLEQVRAIVGNTPVLDEFAALLPFVVVFVAGWWSFYPIERRLRESTVLRALDHGHPVYTIPTRLQYVIANVRHDLLLVLVPLMLIACWSALTRRGIDWLAARGRSGASGELRGVQDAICELGRWMADENVRSLAQSGCQLVGVAAVFTLAPVLLRVIWDTVRLNDGPLRQELEALCVAAKVRVRDVLVWRTHGTLINGAAMGLVPMFRYILLTDALLENLPTRQVHAVMAHEVAHVKYRHIPWLVLSIIGVAGTLSMFGEVFVGSVSLLVGADAMTHADGITRAQFWLSGLEFALGVLSLFATIAAFGWVSRRFEWQADAFAAKALSGLAEETPPACVSPAGAASMIDALASVARLNHIQTNRRSFRHGSIRTRQSKLGAIVDVPMDRVPQDRTVRWIKRITLVCLALTIASVYWEIAKTPTPVSSGVAQSTPTVSRSPQ